MLNFAVLFSTEHAYRSCTLLASWISDMKHGQDLSAQCQTKQYIYAKIRKTTAVSISWSVEVEIVVCLLAAIS